MTSAATPKGLRRRACLIAAAGELLCERGSDAVRHRAVAERADLPLASTTYYFSSLEELVAEAITYVYRSVDVQMKKRANSVARARRGREDTADLLADVVIGPPDEYDSLTARIEAMVIASRSPRLTSVVAEHRRTLVDVHHEALEKSCRFVGEVDSLILVEQGAIALALATNGGDPLKATRLALRDVIDTIAPACAESVDSRPPMVNDIDTGR